MEYRVNSNELKEKEQRFKVDYRRELTRIQMSLDRICGKDNVDINNWRFGFFRYIFICIFYRLFLWFFNLGDWAHIRTNSKNNEIITRELDNNDNSDDTSILSSDLRFYRKNKRMARGEICAPQCTRSDSTKNFTYTEGGNEMRWFRMLPSKIRRLSIPVDDKWGRLDFIIESTKPIKVYLVDGEGLSNFRKGKEFYTYNRVRTGEYFEENIDLPHGGMWYILIHNYLRKITDVRYEIKE